jgi:hypothetical protein
MDDFEEETIEGVVVDVRGPASDGTYELDIKQADDEIVTVAVSAEQYFQLMEDVEESEDDDEDERAPLPRHLLN